MTDNIEALRIASLVIAEPLYDDLLVRETNHRCSNDMQLIVSLLTLRYNRAKSAETKTALWEVRERISILTQSRRDFHRHKGLTLEKGLHHICESLTSLAQPRSIRVLFVTSGTEYELTQDQVTKIALAVNELATNAVKHAFDEELGGDVTIEAIKDDRNNLIITVGDTGLPLTPTGRHGGMGLNLVRRLITSVNGSLFLPAQGSKVFTICVPLP